MAGRRYRSHGRHCADRRAVYRRRSRIRRRISPGVQLGSLPPSRTLAGSLSRDGAGSRWPGAAASPENCPAVVSPIHRAHHAHAPRLRPLPRQFQHLHLLGTRGRLSAGTGRIGRAARIAQDRQGARTPLLIGGWRPSCRRIRAGRTLAERELRSRRRAGLSEPDRPPSPAQLHRRSPAHFARQPLSGTGRTDCAAHAGAAPDRRHRL